MTSYHLLAAPSVDDVNTRLAPEHRMTYLNFRPNIVVDDCEKYAEDDWTWVRIGDKVILRTVKPCTRFAIYIHTNTCTFFQEIFLYIFLISGVQQFW